jgi:ADP-heptose:LPS heptosyltransferase
MIIKSELHLGDSIHAYMIVKNMRDAGESASLITKNEYKFLFDKKYLTNNINEIDYDFSNHKHNIKYLTNRKIHIRDAIASNFTEVKVHSHRLQPLVKPWKGKTAVICNRSTKSLKEWRGKWNNVIDHLTSDGYSVIFDNPCYDLSTIASYVSTANLVISIDTGLIHLAEAYNVPLVGLYGKGLNRFHPYNAKDSCIEMPLVNLTPTHIIDKIEELKWSDKYGLSYSIEGQL